MKYIIKSGKFFTTAGIALILILFISCNRDENSPGWVYMPDMAYSEAYETYSENPNFSDRITMRQPVKGTVPREMIPYQFGKSFDEQVRAGKELMNPMELTVENLEQGKQQYAIFCINCHGSQGNSDGHLITSGLFTAKPIALSGDYAQSKPEGEIFHVITMGSLSGLMGAHGAQISQENRWKIVMYVKNKFSTNL
jgi:mono/diheme cytochrome c family protein